MFLLDTDTVIYTLKGHETVQRNLRKYVDYPIKITVITLMELYYGAYKSKRMTSNVARLKMIERDIEIILADQQTAEIFGMIKVDLEKRGLPLDDFDLIIASCALAHNLTLVTNNTRHFQRIDGLNLVNWLIAG